jgi:mannose/cellobiose epimerase-like protein (N-acyl-D-glucosamine 2-epimerase family)/anti-anti-sigma regulatory factor
MTNPVNFTFSDLISGYVTAFDPDTDVVGLRTSDGRAFSLQLTDSTYAEFIRNLGEGYQSVDDLRNLLAPGQLLFAYGIHYPDGAPFKFEAKHLVLTGPTDEEHRFEQPLWWVHQIRELANFYIRAEFGTDVIDYRNYRTTLNLEGEKVGGTFRQETDTISRLVYGFATAYLLTGDDTFLEAAEKGTQYLRDHMRSVDTAAGIIYWSHAIDVDGDEERKVLASEFGDDYDAIPAYEQIYALAGPTQTYRITGDPQILDDIHKTITLFDKFFLDPDQGSYYSHIDPVTFSGTADVLGHNRARKNWNSVGDHAPAYLINAYLATGDEKFAEFLAGTMETIITRFPDYEHSPFVNEKFHEDWTPDHHWGWQQNRAVVGHNLKIAWNLMRANGLKPDPRYVELAEKIAALMPQVGYDTQRFGWYDVMERQVAPGDSLHRFVWHDRKAWWQQEQGILAYMILAGEVGKPEYRNLARESAAFYNAWFLDQDAGAVYFNVFANGMPYLLGNERLKGSHSMAGYHSFELAYLAAVYTNLLHTMEPLDLYFKPQAGAFPGGLLRVSPDILPAGAIKIDQVWIDGELSSDFDAAALTVTLPPDRQVSVKVRVVATKEDHEVTTSVAGDTATVTVTGAITDEGARRFERSLQEVAATGVTKVVLDVSGVTSITPSVVRAVILARQHLPLTPDSDIVVVNPSDVVKAVFSAAESDSGGIRMG